MLLNIFIRDFGIIDTLKMDMKDGLNVLTGETGAGKSIVIDALLLALGGRASLEQIRTGAEKALIHATFDAANNQALGSLLEENGIEAPEDNIIVMTREVIRTGKNLCRINGQVVTLGLYRRIGAILAELHVQHEQNSLIDPGRHRELLDRYGGVRLLEALNEVRHKYYQWQSAYKNYQKYSQDVKERTGRIEALNYQINEIEQACLCIDEDENLEAERQILHNYEKIGLLAERAYHLMYEGAPGQSPVVDLLAQGIDSVKALANLDSRVNSILSAMESALHQVVDASRELADYKAGIEHNPARMEEVEERLGLIKKLKRKYGATISDISNFLEGARNELTDLENIEELLEQAAAEQKNWEADYLRAAEVLGGVRREVAGHLEKAVSSELKSLEMGRVEFQVFFDVSCGATAEGLEKVEFLISPNPGEPLKSLAKIASGGELTRIMLALKALLANLDDVPVLVFDEADSGIGGRALHAVAEKMYQLGQKHQVICVTHSAQVACYAVAHHRISKVFDGERTVIRVEILEPEERREELARMLGGREVTEITRKHVVQMLKMASNK